jgi:arsenate reductase
MFQYILYGIPTCDTTNAALKWLKEHAVDFHFHNLKNEDVAIEKLQAWCKQVGWKKLLNKQSMTFRSLHPVLKLNATN